MVANTPRPASLIVDTPTSSPLRHVPIAARRAAVGIRPVADADDAEADDEGDDDDDSEWGDVVTTSMPEDDEDDDDEDNDSDDESAVDALRDSSIAAERSLRSTLTDDHATGAGSGTNTPLVANSCDSGSSGAGA